MNKLNVLTLFSGLLILLLTSSSCEVCDLDLSDETAPDINILVQEGDATAYVLEEDNLALDDFDTPITLTVFGVDDQSAIHVLNLEVNGIAVCLDGPQDINAIDPIMNEYPLDDNGCSISSRNIPYEIPTITSCPNPNPLEATLVSLEWSFTVNSINHAGLQSERVITVSRD